MRSKGSAEELGRRRLLAVRRVLEGRPAAEVARFLEVNERTVRGWARRYEAGGAAALAPKAHAGPAPRLTDQQCQELELLLLRGPTAHGWPNELWTGGRVREVIRR